MIPGTSVPGAGAGAPPNVCPFPEKAVEPPDEPPVKRSRAALSLLCGIFCRSAGVKYDWPTTAYLGSAPMTRSTSFEPFRKTNVGLGERDGYHEIGIDSHNWSASHCSHREAA